MRRAAQPREYLDDSLVGFAVRWRRRRTQVQTPASDVAYLVLLRSRLHAHGDDEVFGDPAAAA